MHASIDQLLSIRDGEPVDAEISQHARSCASCCAELERLQQVTERLRSLEMPQPPALAWEQIRNRLEVSDSSRPRRIAFASAAALAAAVVLSGLWLRYSGSESPQHFVASTQPVQPVVPIEHLLAQSRELDELLSYLPQRPAVERVAMAATIDTIEQRVQWLDQQLSYAPVAGLDDAQTYQLWRERVDLMDSLVKVRYAEGGPMSF
jgi:hypothetical protein